MHDAWSEPHVEAQRAYPPMYEFLAKNIGIRRASGEVNSCLLFFFYPSNMLLVSLSWGMLWTQSFVRRGGKMLGKMTCWDGLWLQSKRS